MSKQIDGVPESIPRKAFADLYRSLGIDPSKTTTLEFHPDGVHATLFATDENGKVVVDKLKKEVMMHEIYIPVKDEPHVRD